MKISNTLAQKSVLLVLAILLVAPLRSDAIVIGASVDNGNGTFTYSYTVDNTAGTFDIAAFSLEFNFLSSLIDWDQSGADVPDANWIALSGFPIVGISSQDFFSIDPASDVLTGFTLSGFSFVSALAPGIITYYFEFGALGESSFGTTVGPVPGGGNTGGGGGEVPVTDGGSSIALVLVSLSCLFGLSRRVRAGQIAGC